jgi:hypothetical protein
MQRPEEAGVHMKRLEEAPVHMQRPEEAPVHMQGPEEASLPLQLRKFPDAWEQHLYCMCQLPANLQLHARLKADTCLQTF